MGWWGVPRGERAERARRALDLLHIGDLADRYADTLSRRRGAARAPRPRARALALGSDALLLEPFAGLDPPTRAALPSDASTALADPERATLVVVHDRAEAWALADRLVVLLDGGIAAECPPQEVLERPRSVAVAKFLGFTGRVDEADGTTRLVRPANVTIDVGGGHHGNVMRRVPEEDGVLYVVALDRGQVEVRTAYPGPGVGERVTVRVEGGVRLAADGRGLPDAAPA